MRSYGHLSNGRFRPHVHENGRLCASCRKYLLASVPMFGMVQGARDPVRAAIAARCEESGAREFEVTPDQFEQMVLPVVERYAATEDRAGQLALVRTLHVEDLVLARACAAGRTGWITTWAAARCRDGCGQCFLSST